MLLDKHSLWSSPSLSSAVSPVRFAMSRHLRPMKLSPLFSFAFFHSASFRLELHEERARLSSALRFKLPRKHLLRHLFPYLRGMSHERHHRPYGGSSTSFTGPLFSRHDKDKMGRSKFNVFKTFEPWLEQNNPWPPVVCATPHFALRNEAAYRSWPAQVPQTVSKPLGALVGDAPSRRTAKSALVLV